VSIINNSLVVLSIESTIGRQPNYLAECFCSTGKVHTGPVSDRQAVENILALCWLTPQPWQCKKVFFTWVGLASRRLCTSYRLYRSLVAPLDPDSDSAPHALLIWPTEQNQQSCYRYHVTLFVHRFRSRYDRRLLFRS
jgi:hypothetical protein